MNLKQLLNGDSRLSEIVRFGIVGGGATILQIVIYMVFVEYVHVRAVPSTLISYGISFIFNFFLSSYFTFHKRPTAQNGLGFLLSHAINMGLQTGLVAIFKEIIPPSIALLPALAICIPTNYLLVRFAFTSKFFNKKEDTSTGEEAEGA